MDMEYARQLFIDEAHELLQSMEACLLEVEDGSAGIEQHIDAIFRAAHTIKGSAGLFGFDDVVAFTHNVESVLDKVRAGQLLFDNTLAELILDCHTHLSQLIDSLSDASLQVDKDSGSRLLTALAAYLAPAAPVAAADTAAPDTAEPELWRIHIRYGEEVFRDGMDPCSQLSFLQQLGQLTDVKLSCVLPLDNFDPESCYFDLVITLDSQASKQQIEDVFEFIQDSCDISIQTPTQMATLLQQLPQQEERLGQVLLDAGVVTQRELSKALHSQQASLQQQDKAASVGALLVQQGAVDPGLVEAAAQRQKNAEPQRLADVQFLKVEARRLDSLINLIGELVTAGAANELLISQLNDEKLAESFSVMTYLLEQIRDSALGLRMVQIGDSFGRLKRIVRDVSKELGKDIQLDIGGAETELDKSMVEKLSDPLMHIVRNALDHGIEPRDLRLYKGKPAHGHLWLNAYHEAGAVVIEIRDDGAGLDAEKIRAKAIEKGLIQSGQQLGKEDIYKLIFEPGFSTAASVTNLSGRGVGMDVVKRNLEELRGQIFIESDKDVGTTFRIRLPLTLAIIDGFEVSVGNTHLILPLNMVQECIEFKDARLAEQRDYLDLRGEVLPFIRVEDILHVSARAERENIIVVQYGKNRAGLVVGQLHGELQAVIKPLHPVLKGAKGISGSTILGSGDIGFILDVPQLIDFAINKETKTCMN